MKNLANALTHSLDITISQVIIIPVHGSSHVLLNVEDAVKFILRYDEATIEPILRYEIIIRYNNGDEYAMKCSDKRKTIQFLNQNT